MYLQRVFESQHSLVLKTHWSDFAVPVPTTHVLAITINPEVGQTAFMICSRAFDPKNIRRFRSGIPSEVLTTGRFLERCSLHSPGVGKVTHREQSASKTRTPISVEATQPL